MMRPQGLEGLSIHMSNRNPISNVRSVVTLASDRELSFLAGGIAFFAFFSIIPAILLVFALGTLVGGEAFANRIVTLVESYLSAEGVAVLDEALADPSGVVGASVVGALALVWSLLKVFRAVDIAFDRIYQIETSTSLLEQLRNGMVAVVAIGAGFALLVAIQMLVLRFGDVIPYTGLVGALVAILGLAVVFAPLYYVMPPARIPFSEAIPGTIVAVVGLVVLQQGFQVYAANAGTYQAYGFIGAVLLFLLWLYFGALVLLLGAVVNAALADRAPLPSRGPSPAADDSSAATGSGDDGGQTSRTANESDDENEDSQRVEPVSQQ